jgi:hypothetical protein
MNRISIPGLGQCVVVGDRAQATLDTIARRAAFAEKYCAERGWDRDGLTIKQIMEIRSQDGWK